MRCSNAWPRIAVAGFLLVIGCNGDQNRQQASEGDANSAGPVAKIEPVVQGKDDQELAEQVKRDIQFHPAIQRLHLNVGITKVENGYVTLTLIGTDQILKELLDPPRSGLAAGLTDYSDGFIAAKQLESAISKNAKCKGVFWTELPAMESREHLQWLVLAMHNYLDQNRHFPAHASYGSDGKPLLSWRVLILPYVDNSLYQQFHLDEPWDSEHNRKFIDRMPEVYRSPALNVAEKSRTSYVVPLGSEAMFADRKATAIQDVTDGTSNTIMIVEVPPANAVIWSKPDDLPFDPSQPTKGLAEVYPGGFWAGMADGSTRFLPTKVFAHPDLLRAMFTRTGSDPIDWDEVAK